MFPAIDGKGFSSISGLNNSIGYGGGFNDVDQNFGIGDDLTWVVGRHTVRFGVDFRRAQQNYYNQGGLYGGNYSYSRGSTNNGSSGGDAMASFILGELNSFTDYPDPVPEYYRYHYYAGYAQDDYKVLPQLTLNIGLRWEYETPRMEKWLYLFTSLRNL